MTTPRAGQTESAGQFDEDWCAAMDEQVAPMLSKSCRNPSFPPQTGPLKTHVFGSNSAESALKLVDTMPS